MIDRTLPLSVTKQAKALGVSRGCIYHRPKPVSAEDQQRDGFEPGVHCPNCVDEISEERKRRFAERQAMWEKQGRVKPRE